MNQNGQKSFDDKGNFLGYLAQEIKPGFDCFAAWRDQWNNPAKYRISPEENKRRLAIWEKKTRKPNWMENKQMEAER
tara:strand:+ start:2100 stop:2330 length:231 start_codon:yes stop_codon:yes gene_type:complete